MKCTLFPGSIINTVINEQGDQSPAPFMRRSSYCRRGKWWSVTFEGVCECVARGRVLTCVCVVPLLSKVPSHYKDTSPWPNIRKHHWMAIAQITTATSKTHHTQGNSKSVTPKRLPFKILVPGLPTIPQMFWLKTSCQCWTSTNSFDW